MSLTLCLPVVTWRHLVNIIEITYRTTRVVQKTGPLYIYMILHTSRLLYAEYVYSVKV